MRAAILTLALAGCTVTQQPAEATVPSRRATLLFFSDAHAQLEAHPELFWTAEGESEIVLAGGYARLAQVAGDIRRETGGRALLIDGGDTFQGSGPAAWSEGEAIIAPQRALGVDLGIPGNWEVVYGPPRMKALMGAVGYPMIAANIVDEASGEPILPATLVREVGGIRIGFVGLADPDVPIRQAPAYSRGLRYLDATSIEPHVRALRESADVVVLLAHVGLARTIAIAEQIEGIDVVLSGDTHERVYEPIRRGDTIIVEPGGFASFLGRLDIELVPGARPRLEWVLIELRADRFAEDTEVARVVRDSLVPWRARAERVIGHTHVPLERYGVVENGADEVLADAIRAETGVEIALSNGFRFGHPIEPGPIRERDLWMLFPVSTLLRVGTVTGAQLRAFWESEIDHVFADDPRRLFGGWIPRVSGMTVRFRSDRPRGQRVLSIAVNGEPLDDERVYSIAACEREGDTDDALCRIRGVANARTLEIDVHAAVRRQLAARGPIRAVVGGRVIAEDLPPRVLSQYERR
jgi:2',3'-cyclic-nucleotide 2'-phosphodiesterase (5'-nucleotidase family)